MILYRPGEYNLSFPVLVIQINSSDAIKLPENSTVSMTFNISEVCVSNFTAECNNTYITDYGVHAYFITVYCIHIM